jgi:hypothetical protein
LSFTQVLISLALSLALASSGLAILLKNNSLMMAEGVGFEPTVGLPLRLISSQVPLTTQPPFREPAKKHIAQVWVAGKLIRRSCKPRVDSCPASKRKQEGAGG